MANQSANLRGKRVAALFTNGVEQVEFTEPAEALRQAGASVTVIAPQAGEIKGWNHVKGFLFGTTPFLLNR